MNIVRIYVKKYTCVVIEFLFNFTVRFTAIS